MKMLVVRETKALSTRERLSHDEYLVVNGEVVGFAVVVSSQEDEENLDTSGEMASEVEQKKESRHCSVLPL